MDRITASRVFIAIIEQGSMVKAAEVSGMSRSMVTRYLSEIEDWAGARLLHRSTRKLTLTNAGEKVLDGCYKLREIEQEVQSVSNAINTRPQGVLRIGTSQTFSEHVLTEFIGQYLARYPDVSIDMQISNHLINLVEERVDLAIRITNELDPNIIARQFGQINSVVCASADYLKKHGTPTHIHQLARHNCLTYSYFGNSAWNFTYHDKPDSVTVTGNLNANDPATLLRATLLGCGISLQPVFATTPYLESGALIPLLPEYVPQTFGVYGIYRSRKHMSKALRVFIDELAGYINTLAL